MERRSRTGRLTPRRVPPDPQAVQWERPEERSAFTEWIVDEIRKALDARARHIADGGLIDTWHSMYEQAERARQARPWADAADLASYIPCEKVDALRARLVKVVFGHDPICTVEGWGVEAKRVSKVEAFHQWKAEDEKLQRYVANALHSALIEGNGILEVSERIGFKKSRGPFRAKPKLDQFLRPVLNDQLALEPETDPGGALVPWAGDPQEPYVEVLREKVDFHGRGPQYRAVSLKDFLFLPAQAADESECWGYAKRIWMRPPDLEQRVQQGLYDAEAVAGLGTDGERDTRAEHLRAGITIAEQHGSTAEKELWEVHLLKDIDGDEIEEWLIVVVSLKHQALLRSAFDSLEQARFVSFTPFPRPTSVYGYSFVGHKLWTIADEHTALRNMKADRQTMALNAPITRLTTSLWDPEDQPFSPRAVIDVRSHDDIKQLVIQDVPASTIESERTTLGAAERVSGLGDTAVSGIQPDTRRTATEHNYAAQGSFVRIDESVSHVQEALEQLYDLRHALWQRALAAEESGLVAPDRVLKGLQLRGIELPKDGPFKFLAADLEGTFRFKPRGSTENADKRVLRQDLGEFTQALSAVFQLSPMLAQQFQMNVEAGQELLEHVLRLWDFQNLQVFLRATPGIAAPQGVLPAGAPALDAGGGGLPPMLAQALPAILAQLSGRGGAPGGVM